MGTKAVALVFFQLEIEETFQNLLKSVRVLLAVRQNAKTARTGRSSRGTHDTI